MKNENIMSETKRIDVNIVELATELARCAVLKDVGYNEKLAYYEDENGSMCVQDEVQEDFDSYYDYYYEILEKY